MQKRIHARLPQKAFKPDLREVIGPLKTYPHTIDTFEKKGVIYGLWAKEPGLYQIFKNRVLMVSIDNEYTAEEAFKQLRENT